MNKEIVRCTECGIKIPARKGHSFMPVPLKVLIADNDIQKQMPLFACSCFGGNESVFDDDVAQEAKS